MKENNLSLDQLLRSIRDEAALLDSKEPLLMLTTSQQLKKAIDDLDSDLSAIKCDYVVQLLSLDGISFLQSAYVSILGRQIDQVGLDGYLSLLRSGTSKIRILKDLQRSDEANIPGVRLRGPWLWRLYLKFPRRGRVGSFFSMFDTVIEKGLLISVFLSNYLNRSRAVKVSEVQIKSHLAFSLLQDQLNSFARQLSNLNDRIVEVDQSQTLDVEVAALRGQLNYFQHSISLENAQSKNVEISQEKWSSLDAFYVAFEDECRGDQQSIQHQQSRWLDFLPEASTDLIVLDIGCGRGEWLSLLREKGFSVKGLEINAVMQKVCVEKGLDVSCEQALTWLKACEKDSLTAVTAFHVVEHIPFELLLSWATEIYRALEPGGVMIFETPNPENLLVGSHTFYHDPTHKNPLTPTLMQFLARYVGFHKVEIVRLHPYPESAKVKGMDALTERLNGHLCGPQDFGLVAFKPSNI